MTTQIKRALVTGGAGFIGSHLVDALVKSGSEVIVVDDLSTGRRSNLTQVMDAIRFRQGDVRDSSLVSEAARSVEVIFHLAAVVSVPQTIGDPVGSLQVNELGTLNVLEAAREQKVRRVVFSSSCAVYGDDPLLPKTESMPPRPCSPYAVQKLAGEHYCRLYADLHGLETVCLRYFNVFGPRQDPSSAYSGVISIFLTQALDAAPPTIYGDGRQSRDFIFVSDVVGANITAARASSPGGIYNIGSGSAVSVNQLWEKICALVGKSREPVYAPARPGDIRYSLADIARAAAELEFRPDSSFEAGLESTFAWYRKHFEAASKTA
jgi:UDP-glucose 4-epimerase